MKIRSKKRTLEALDAAAHHLVEDVVGALAGRLFDHTRLLQQVVLNVAAGNLPRVVEVHPDVLAEPGGVVVPHRLGVPERFQNLQVFEYFAMTLFFK